MRVLYAKSSPPFLSGRVGAASTRPAIGGAPHDRAAGPVATRAQDVTHGRRRKCRRTSRKPSLVRYAAPGREQPRRCSFSITARLWTQARVLVCARVNNRPPRVTLRGFCTLQRERRSSAPAASKPSGALDRRMWIALRCDWRRLGRLPGHLRWRHADPHDDPISVTLVGDPAGTGICSSPPFNLSDRLRTRH
jgi:hypothetical protein